MGEGFVGIDVWEDPAAMEAYFKDVVIPACNAVGVPFERPELIELKTFLTTTAATDYAVPYTRELA